MSEIVVEDKGGKKNKVKRLSTRVDMAPMCDLGFLLITFFMLSTSMAKPQTMDLNMPSRDKVSEAESSKVKESQAVTVLLGKDDKVYYFFGSASEEKIPDLKASNFSPSGIRDVLLQRNAEVAIQMRDLRAKLKKREISDEEFAKKSVEIKSSKNAPTVIIKATDEANYKNMVDILDEMQICSISRYALVDITDYDKELIKELENPGSSMLKK